MIELVFFALLVGYNMAQNPDCVQPIDPGPCRGYFPRFGFNVTSWQCEPFIYGGCKGNSNNYESAAKCEDTCFSQCMQPIVPGPCKGSFPRYGFNVTSWQCEPFIYGGCKGNSNNFESAAECDDTCFSRCMQPIVPGPCKGSFPRYGFNVTSWQCEHFIYGGCKGNSNSFLTLAECQETCEESCPE